MLALVIGGNTDNCSSSDLLCSTWSMCDKNMLIWLLTTSVGFSLIMCPLFAIPIRKLLVQCISLGISQLFTIFGIIMVAYKSESCYIKEQKPVAFVVIMICLRVMTDLITLLLLILYKYKFIGQDKEKEKEKAVESKAIELEQKQEPVTTEQQANVDVDKLKSFSMQTNCSKCQNKFEPEDKVKMLECCHILHEKCATEWFAENTRCPQCVFKVEIVIPRELW